MNAIRKSIYAAFALLFAGVLCASALTSEKVRFTLDGGGAVRTPGNDGAVFSDDDLISSGEVAGLLPLPAFHDRDRIGVDALIVLDDEVIFSSDVDFMIGTNSYGDEDLVAYAPTSGTFRTYFDGSFQGLPQPIDVDAATLVPGSNVMWFSVDGPFSTVSDHDVLQWDFGVLLTQKYDGYNQMSIPKRANIDAMHHDGTNLYFSLDTTETIDGFTARDDDIWVFNTVNGFYVGVITGMHTELGADISALDEWHDWDADGLTDFEERSGSDEGSTLFAGTYALLTPNGHTSNPHDFDTDDDGYSDGQEGAAGTDPNSDTSYLKLTSIEDGANGQVIKWASATGRYYQVYAAPHAGAYTSRVAALVYSGGMETGWTNTLGWKTPLFRVRLEPSP